MAKKGAAKAGDQAADGGDQTSEKKSGGGFVGLAILAVGAMTSSFATVYVLASDPPTGPANNWDGHRPDRPPTGPDIHRNGHRPAKANTISTRSRHDRRANY